MALSALPTQGTHVGGVVTLNRHSTRCGSLSVERVGEEELVGTREAARRLGISMRALQHWARTGQVKPALVTPGGVYRWRVSEVERQLAELRERRERGEDE